MDDDDDDRGTQADIRAALYRIGFDLAEGLARPGHAPEAIRFGLLCWEEISGEAWGDDAWRGLEAALRGRPCEP